MHVAQHAAFTFCGIEMASYLGLFPRKTVPRMKITPLAFAFVAFVVSGGSHCWDAHGTRTFLG